MMHAERAEMNRIRLERNWTYAVMAADVGVRMHTLYRFLARNGKPNERTAYIFQQWLARQESHAPTGRAA